MSHYAKYLGMWGAEGNFERGGWRGFSYCGACGGEPVVCGYVQMYIDMNALTFLKSNIHTHIHTHKQFVLTGTFGTGLVMTKDGEGHWSAPAAVAIAGSG